MDCWWSMTFTGIWLIKALCVIACGKMPTEVGPWETKWLWPFSYCGITGNKDCGEMDSLSASEQLRREDREYSKWILRMLDQGGWNRILESTRSIGFDVLMSVYGLNILIRIGSNSLFWLSDPWLFDSLHLFNEIEMPEHPWQNAEQIQKAWRNKSVTADLSYVTCISTSLLPSTCATFTETA